MQDDGTPVEPAYYAPVIPMIIVNGGKGIGTGFSSDTMPHNPSQIIEYIHKSLQDCDSELPMIEPYYEGFKGTITKITDSKYLIKGTYDIISDNKVRITELPIGTWTDNYKQDLENMIDKHNNKSGKSKPQKKHCITDYTDMSTDTIVDITVTFTKGVLNTLVMKETENEIKNSKD